MSLYNKTSLSFQTLGRLESLTLSALKVWWKTLSNDEQESLCRIDYEDIMSGLVNAAEDAFYLCRISPTYKKKDLMSKGDVMDENGEARHLMIQFNLAGKEVVKNGWADLLSCFYLIKSKSKKAKEHNLKTDNLQEECLKPYVSVKRDKLDAILDLLAGSVPHFGEGDKSVYDGQTLVNLFPIILSSEIDVSIMDLKPDFKTLLKNLVAIAAVLEHQIYLAYFQQVNSKIGQAVVDQFDFLSSQLELVNEELPTLLMAKTVSQLEKSGKPCQSLLTQPDLDDSPSVLSTRSRFSEELDQADPCSQFYENMASCSYYDGFIVEDLVVDFAPSDHCLIPDEERSLRQSYSVCRQHDVQQQYPFHQGPYVSQPMHFPQQHYLPPPVNFGIPMQSTQNKMPNYGGYYPPQGYQPLDYPNSAIYAHQSTAGLYDYQQNFHSYRSDNNSHFLMESRLNKEEKSQHHPKPQLPPRLQKKKEQMLHFHNSQIVN